MHLFKTGKLHRAAAAFMVFVLCFTLEAALVPTKARAEDNLLGDASWQFLFAAPMATVTGIIQSICVTDHYIITLENVADSADTLDIVSAYYRWSSDEYGNPVQQYSLAKRVQSEEWEHGNSMCYNPNTGEIYVALYTNTKAENRGSLYVMDPQTLTKTRTIKLTSNFNFLAITYDEVNNIYYAQTNADTGYSILVFDENFNIMANYGPEDPSPGYNFQDFCLTGDYLLEFPLTFGMDIGEYMMAYSVSSRSVVDTIPLSFGYDSSAKVEPESVKALDGSGFIVAVNVTFADGSSQCEFYRAEFPNLGLAASEDDADNTAEAAASGQAVSEGQTNRSSGEKEEAGAETDGGVHGNNNMTNAQTGQEADAEQAGEEQGKAEDQTAAGEQSKAEENTPSNEQSAVEEQAPANERSVTAEQTPANDQSAAGEQTSANEQSAEQEQTTAAEQSATEEQTVTDQRAEADAYGAAKEADADNKKSGVWAVVVILIVLLGLIVVFLYWQHVRLERKKREARIRKARRIMLANMAKEADKYDDLSDYERLNKYK